MLDHVHYYLPLLVTFVFITLDDLWFTVL